MRWADTIVFWAVAACLICLWTALGFEIADQGRDQDFVNLYTGASLARRGEWQTMHSPQVQLAFEKTLQPNREVLVPFVRPHAYALALMPLAWLPHHTAYAVWLGLQTLLLLGCYAWAYQRFGPAALMWGLSFPAAAIGIMHGQDPALLLALTIAGYTLASQRRDEWAGFVWALGLVKFHLLLGLVLVLILQRKWKMLAGFCTGGALLAGIGLLLGGVSGLREYFHLLTATDLPGLAPTPELMINLEALAANLGMPWLRIASTIAAAGLLLAAQRRAPMWRWYSSGMVFGLLTVPHVYAYDGTVLLLPAWLILFESGDKSLQVAAGIYAAPVLIWCNLAGAPWAAANAIALFALLACLSWNACRDSHRTQ